MIKKSKSVLIVGAGIAGIQSALDLADLGVDVHLVEDTPSIGGRMPQLDKTFPTNDCSMCILSPKMSEVARHPGITLHINSSLDGISGDPGEFTCTVTRRSPGPFDVATPLLRTRKVVPEVVPGGILTVTLPSRVGTGI